MKLHGYCIDCHRVRLVRVSGAGLARLAGGRGVPTGQCDSCRDKEDERRKEQRR